MRQKRSLQEPEVLAVLNGVVHRGSRYYRVAEDGSPIHYLVREQLIKLGMCSALASRLLQQATETGLVSVLPPEEKPCDIARFKPRQPKPSKPRRTWSLEDPRVAGVLTGVSQVNSRTYYKDNQVYPLRRRIMEALNITRTPADAVIKAAIEAGLIPLVAKPQRPKRKVQEPRTPSKPKLKLVKNPVTEVPEPDQSGVQNCDSALMSSQAMLVNPEDDIDAPEPEHRHPRYSLVLTTSGFWGVFDELSFSQRLISRDKADAVEELARLNKPEPKLPYSWKLKEEELEAA
jgi:hypothetical protein